jgi:hypothetical protein
MPYAIAAIGVAAAWFWKVSKGPAWKGWKSEIFGEDK